MAAVEPCRSLSSPFGTTAAADAAYRSFAGSAIREQPREYLRAVARDLVHYARPGRVQRPSDAKLFTWQFFTTSPPRYTSAVTPVGFAGARTEPRLHVPAGSVLRSYQRVGFTPGTVLTLCGLVAVAAALWPGGDRRLRLDCALLAGIGLVLVVVPAMTVALDYRFLLPQLVVLPVAAALAGLRLDPAARTPAPPTPPVHPTDTAQRASGSPGHRESTGTHAEKDAVTDGREPEDAELAGLRAERDRLQRRLDVVRWRVTAPRARRAWRLHTALAEARTGGRGLLLLPGRLLRVLFGPPVVVPPPHS